MAYLLETISVSARCSQENAEPMFGCLYPKPGTEGTAEADLALRIKCLPAEKKLHLMNVDCCSHDYCNRDLSVTLAPPPMTTLGITRFFAVSTSM